ncbi:Hypothetical protein ORPV_851 [Orpheovirus IHUMI-LCC2]|uniref:Uncharacterized protein n=1 Tax=Orpheovirus IHUMI-LCC2 TaxID=2023057 RepID=A0A2I2L5C3_9VIRU|nr:Hypothetical protein ORPV_851 [Orpheovirus IHUMI-LCC2]SNW62755.1 Hypothetical protein ORPV_851 [Orpheovirus IHUMI-LCC2]
MFKIILIYKLIILHYNDIISKYNDNMVLIVGIKYYINLNSCIPPHHNNFI